MKALWVAWMLVMTGSSIAEASDCPEWTLGEEAISGTLEQAFNGVFSIYKPCVGNSAGWLVNTLENTPMPASVRLAQSPQERIKALEQLVYDTRRKLKVIARPFATDLDLDLAAMANNNQLTSVTLNDAARRKRLDWNSDQRAEFQDLLFLIENETFVSKEWGPLFGRLPWAVQIVTGQAGGAALDAHYNQLWKWASGLLTKLSTHYSWDFALPTEFGQASALLFGPYMPRPKRNHYTLTSFTLSGSPNDRIANIVAQLKAKQNEIGEKRLRCSLNDQEEYFKVELIMESRIDYVARGLQSAPNVKAEENLVSSVSAKLGGLITDVQSWRIDLEPLRATLWAIAKDEIEPITTLERWGQLATAAMPGLVESQLEEAQRVARMVDLEKSIDQFLSVNTTWRTEKNGAEHLIPGNFTVDLRQLLNIGGNSARAATPAAQLALAARLLTNMQGVLDQLNFESARLTELEESSVVPEAVKSPLDLPADVQSWDDALLIVANQYQIWGADPCVQSHATFTKLCPGSKTPACDKDRVGFDN